MRGAQIDEIMNTFKHLREYNNQAYYVKRIALTSTGGSPLII